MTAISHRLSKPVRVVAGLHIAGWSLLSVLAVLAVPAPATAAGTGAALLTFGVGGTAYALGLRHAFDADHIAVVDNATRRLVERGRPASSVGAWFAFGHSTVVLVLCAVLAVFGAGISAALADGSPLLHTLTDVYGPVVSAVILLIVAVVNVSGLVRRRENSAAGPVTWLLQRFDAVIDRPSRMYAVGVLFGLGFDTATEIGLLALTGAASLGTASWWSALALPLLFAAGMSAPDALQGAVAARAYGGGSTDNGSNGRGARLGASAVVLVSVAAAVSVALVELASVGTGSRRGSGLDRRDRRLGPRVRADGRAAGRLDHRAPLRPPSIAGGSMNHAPNRIRCSDRAARRERRTPCT